MSKINKDYKHVFAKDVHESAIIDGVEFWRPTMAYPYFVGFGLKKARCGCGRVFKNVEDFNAHYIYKAVWQGEDNYLLNLVKGQEQG